MTLPTLPPDMPSAIDPWWQRLRAWIAPAQQAFTASPAHVTRGQLAPLLGWIYIIEALLRRLVLLAAGALRLTLAPARKQKPKTASRPTPRTPAPPAFRLIGFRAPRLAPRPRILFLDAPPAPRRPAPARPFLAWQTDTLLSAHNRFDAGNWRAPPTRRGASRTLPPPHYEDDLIPPYEPRTLIQTSPASTPARSAPPEHATQPPLALAGVLARFARLAALVAAPDRLIRRAAFRLARLTHRKRFALAQCPPPHPKRQMRAFTPCFRSLLIPAHHLWLRTPSPNSS